jgi:Ca2+-binding RTX toxin-like protein
VATNIAITAQTVAAPVGDIVIYQPTASDTVAAPVGRDMFVFGASGFGHDTITNFSAANDLLQLPKATIASFAALQPQITAATGGTLITVAPAESIMLAGVAPGSPHAANFSFV